MNSVTTRRTWAGAEEDEGIEGLSSEGASEAFDMSVDVGSTVGRRDPLDAHRVGEPLVEVAAETTLAAAVLSEDAIVVMEQKPRFAVEGDDVVPWCTNNCEVNNFKQLRKSLIT